ncbi:MAG TPA: hypothetical protein VK477_00910, partial [Acidobacteriota bacterium]|nr:hypothetical protein [Acidobacteriota bacterium]
ILGALILVAASATDLAAATRAWLMLNPAAEDTLLVTDPAEQQRLEKGGWRTDAVLGLFSEGDAGRSALQRLFKQGKGKSYRLLSGRADEVMRAKESGFQLEGTMGFVALTQTQPELVPVKRFQKDDRLLWLSGDQNQTWAEKAGWKLVGDDFWVLPDGK